jgi:sugar fermentation stimulation protein A
MKFHAPLIEGVLLKRHKRFLAEVQLPNGEQVTAHCANSGSMLSVQDAGARVWLSPAANPERKLRYTWEIIEINKALVGINTSHPNLIVANAIAEGKIPELAGYPTQRREVKYGKNSRIDVLLEAPGKPPCYVEVKNVTMRRDLKGPAEFPDSVTARGAKHLQELGDMVEGGARAVMFYFVQRPDCDRFTIAHDIDPEYGKALKLALKRGVTALCYSAKVTAHGVEIDKALTLDLPA